MKQKIANFVFLCRILKFGNKLASLQLFRVRVRISAFLVKLRRGMMFKNKTLLGKHPKQILSLSFYRLGWLSYLILKFELCANFPETGTPCCQFRVQSCEPGISLDIPRIFLDMESIRAREKRYSLVWIYFNGQCPPPERWIIY